MIVETPAGERIPLGLVETAPTIGIVDRSRRVTDDFGVTTVVKRGFSRRMSVRLAVPFDDVDEVQRRLADLRATPATWIADDRFQSLTIRGFYKDFSIDLTAPPLAFCTLTVEGLNASEDFVDVGEDSAPDGVSTLQLLQPVAITDANLVSSNVAETDHPEWSGAVTYAAGARVIRAATHRIYQSIASGNVGSDPAGTGGKWLNVGPTNRWAMFDQALGTVTSAPNTIVVTLDPGTIGAVALLDVTGATVRVDATGYDRTQPVTAGAITFLDLPANAGRVRVTIAGLGPVSVGTLLAGHLAMLGITEAAPTAGITDYSRKDTDDFGDVTVVERAWSKRMTTRALIRTDAIDIVTGRIAAVRALPSLWIGQEGLDGLTVYGFFRDFSIEVGETVSKLSLTIEGLSKAAPASAPIGGGPVAWPDIVDSDPARPKPTDGADKTSENTSKDTTAVGGVPSAEVLAELERIEPLAEAAELLKRADIDQQALARQRDRDVGKLDEALMRALLEANRTREVMRDAGIVIDPVTGRVRIYGVDQTSERVSRVEIDLDAARSRISLLATSDYVNEQIALAQLDPTGQAALEEVITRLNRTEIKLDGIDATILLKADSTTVTTLGGKVVSVEQELDALGEALTLKASTTEVDRLDTRVKAAELKLDTVGDTSALTIAVRQARYAEEQTAAGSLQALLSADTQHRRQLVAAAEARQELYARIVDGDAAEAVARLTLAVRMADSDARFAREESARVTGDRAQAEALTAAEARIGEAARAQSARLEKVAADGDKVSAEAIQQLTARLNGNGVTIEDKIAAVVEANGKITGTRTLAIDINNNLVGTQLIGSEEGRGSLNLINADLRLGTGRVIFNTGTFMQVQGIGFGRDSNLLEWFGPTMAIDQCTKANGVTFKTVDGEAYFGGGLSAGTFRNTGASTTVQGNASVMIGPFRSNSRPRDIVVSYGFYGNTSITGACPVPQPPNPSVVIDLYRGSDAGGVLLTSRTLTGYYGCDPGFGDRERGAISEQITGSFTLTDGQAGDTFSYFVRLRDRQVYVEPSAQTLSLISTEE